MEYKTLKSTEDESVNFIKETSSGYLECRYVRRTDDYFIVYLSSQSGCNRGCKFCHLTATGQTKFENVTAEEYIEQTQQVFNHYLTKKTAKEVNFNWMARGEALANSILLENAFPILSKLTQMSSDLNLFPKFNISTIMPRNLQGKDLKDIFRGITPTIYYSLYSLDPVFRKQWMPGALGASVALDMLTEYQLASNKIIKLHWAFIEGQNDSIECLDNIFNEIDKRNLIVDFNLVRYNPYSPLQGQEPSIEVLNRNLNYIKSRIQGRARMINRVGFDVKASCGMFIEKKD